MALIPEHAKIIDPYSFLKCALPNGNSETFQRKNVIILPLKQNIVQRDTVKGLTQIVPGARMLSKNGYFAHSRAKPDRPLSDFTGTRTISRNRADAGVSKRLLPILPPFPSDRKAVNNLSKAREGTNQSDRVYSGHHIEIEL